MTEGSTIKGITSSEEKELRRYVQVVRSTLELDAGFD